jgi:hypothetical protein
VHPASTVLHPLDKFKPGARRASGFSFLASALPNPLRWSSALSLKSPAEAGLSFTPPNKARRVVFTRPLPIVLVGVLRRLLKLIFGQIHKIATEIGVVLKVGPRSWVRIGRSYRETAEERADRESLIRDMMGGQ